KIQKLIHENEKNFGVRQNILFEDTQNGWLKHEIPHDKGPQKINFSLGLDKNNLLVYGNRRDLYHYQKTATGFELLDKKQMYIVSIDKITDEIYVVKDQYGAEYLLSKKNGKINFEKHEGKPFLFGFQQVSPSIVLTGRPGESFRILKINEDKSIEELVDEDNPYGGNVFSARVLYDRWFLMFRSDGSAAYYVDLQEREKGLQVLKEEVHLFEPLEGGDDKYFVAIGKKQADSTLFRFTSDGIYKYPFDENNFDDGQSRRYSFLVTPEGVEFKGKYILRRNDQLFDREFE
ncbi:MAG: hypothetical protein VX642_06965, partial [Bdellovibrionota bacterium]|nr:hypothetical protein [Bdellovibrionota bacterium]